MCKTLNVSRAAYYKWMNRKPNIRSIENIFVLKEIKKIDKDKKHLFGSYRMTIIINKLKGKNYNQKRIARLMCVNDIQSSFRKKKTNWKRSTPEISAENKLARKFESTKPNEKWCTDVTETKIPGTSKKVYISTILDLYDRFPVGYSTSLRNDVALVNKSYDMSLGKHSNEETLFHNDRGFQYTRKVFGTRLQSDGFKQSMSRVGHCIDNGPMEGFQGIMKDEIFILYDIQSVDDFTNAFEKYMHFYIYERPQKRYNGKTPHEVRTEALELAEPKQYPIPKNRKIEAYWKDISRKQEKTQLFLNT